MQRVRQNNRSTKSALRHEFHALGLRDCIHVPILSKPRWVAEVEYIGRRIAVFVDSCFWNGCPSHATWPKQNAEFWRGKIVAGQKRDHDTDGRLRADGGKLVRVWAHEPPDEAVSPIAKNIKTRRTQGQVR